MAKAEKNECEQKFVVKCDKFVNNELGDIYKNEPNIDIYWKVPRNIYHI